MVNQSVKSAALSIGLLLMATACSEATAPQKSDSDAAQSPATSEQSAKTTVPASEPARSPAPEAPASAGEPIVVAEAEKSDDDDDEEAAGPGSLAETVKAEVGTLKNPFTDNAEAIEEGKKLYFAYSCNGCHGGGGGGGMCPPLTNEVFVYGSDDDTIFRLIALGSDDFTKQTGKTRVGGENVVGPMPGYVDIITRCEDEETCKKKPHIDQSTTDQLWKMIAWIRTKFNGRPERRDW